MSTSIESEYFYAGYCVMAHAQKMRLKKSFDFLNHFFISFKEGLEARKKDKKRENERKR